MKLHELADYITLPADLNRESCIKGLAYVMHFKSTQHSKNPNLHVPDKKSSLSPRDVPCLNDMKIILLAI